MDDIPDSVETIDEANRVMNNIDIILKEGGFTIKEWIVSGQEKGDINMISNDQRVVKTLMKEELQDDRTEKVLGMKWDTFTDKLIFPTNKMNENIVMVIILGQKISQGAKSYRMLMDCMIRVD